MEDFSAKGGPASGWNVVAVGGATADLFLLIDPQNPHLKFNPDTNELSIHLGDKVVLENSKLTVGGNANNVAVGLKRLGLNTALMAEIGNDEFSDEILKNLKKEGVDSSLVKRGESPASFSVILNYEEDRTIFTKKVEKEHDFDFSNLSTKWAYLTSLGNKWEEAYKKVSEFVQNSGSKLAFNPGPTQLDKVDSFSYLLPQTEIFIVNKEEAEKLVGAKEIKQSLRSDDLKDLLFELKKLGPKIVVITDGKKGSFAMNENAEVFSQDALKVRVISKTGAGDAYSSGFLGAVLSGHDIQTAMVWGTKNAASVITQIGAQTGLLTKEQIEK